MDNMKQNPSCNRSSKPPPARSSCFIPSRSRQLNVESQPMVTPVLQTQDSHKVSNDGSGNVGLTGGPSGERSLPNFGPMAASPKEVSDCLSGWLSYLQMLNGLCGAGSRLSHSLGALVQDPSSPCHVLAAQCQTVWEELVKATTVASSAVKSQVLAALQEINTTGDGDTETQMRLHENNQQVLCGSLMTFINLHYQFCAACCEYLGTMPTNCCNVSESSGQRHNADCSVGKLQQCFSRLYSPSVQVAPPHRPSRNPCHLTLCSLQGTQRRWSEAAAGELGGESGDGMVRRWSMPWDSCRQVEHSAKINHPSASSKLVVPSPGSAQDKSRSTTPESVWHSSLASQDELQDVIQLLSCRPGFSQSTQLYHPNQQIPGVTLTTCPYDGPPVDCGAWGESGGESGGPSRRGSNSPSVHHSWQAPDTWSEHDSHMLDPDVLASRKSSSSTDSSSSYSLHARSSTGSEGSAEVRAHLYSMWSGSDLTFIKVPESSEPPEAPSPSSSQQRGPQADSSQTFYSNSK